jgi:deaminated glutathione amidase
MHATDVKADNLEKAEGLVARAARDGAELIVLPEHWEAGGSNVDAQRMAAGPIEGGETVESMRGWARQHGVTIVGGSINESRDGSDRLFNTCVVVDGAGDIAAVYRKIHMFDVDIAGQAYRESDTHEPGDEVVTWEMAEWTVGLTICYDLRFPELYRILALAGAQLVTVPANFTMFTGKDHWEILLRTRAVENQCYVVAPNQWGPQGGRASYGRSMIVDPWGIVLGAASDADTVVSATLDLAQLARVRRDLPALANRRSGAYRWPAPA